jgi:hypothetical protein
MVVVPPIWIGWRAVVFLPLERVPLLIIWQYSRMLRPYVVLGGVVAVSLGVGEVFNPKPGGLVALGLVLAVFAVAITLWITLGRLLDRFEFVRLLRYDKSAGTVTIRFSTESLAQQASEVLVLFRETKADNEKSRTSG